MNDIAGLRGRLMAEGKTMLLLFVYLSLLLGSFTMYRRLVLAQYDIEYFQYGYNFVEAFVLAKVIILGRMLRLGDRFRNHPLIVPTLYKTAWFGLLLLAFSLLESLISGWLHGKTARAIFHEILDQDVWEILARTLVKAMALVPLLAVWEFGRVFGEGKLFELFFTKGTGQACTSSASMPAPPLDASDHRAQSGRP